MINALKNYRAWSSRREQRELARWERIRADGKLRFVLNASLSFGLTVVGLMDVFGERSISLPYVIYYVLVGIPAGFLGWSNMESKYQRALHKARVPKLSNGELPPHDYPLRITSN